MVTTGVTVPAEVQSEITKLSKEFASQVKQKKVGQTRLPKKSPEKVKQIDDY